MELINGKEIQAFTLTHIGKEVESLKEKGVEICLAVIIVGNDPASRVYVNNKKKACANVGITSLEYALPQETTTEELIALIDKLNADKSVNGILCQMPVPKQIDKQAVIDAILPEKDVDCFHPVNIGKLSLGRTEILPCTPAGIIRMLEFSGVKIEGSRAVIIGRSDIVGKPMAMLLLNHSATVTVCHSKTVDLPSVTRQADILISAVGKPDIVTEDMVKEASGDENKQVLVMGLTNDAIGYNLPDTITTKGILTPLLIYNGDGGNEVCNSMLMTVSCHSASDIIKGFGELLGVQAKK